MGPITPTARPETVHNLKSPLPIVNTPKGITQEPAKFIWHVYLVLMKRTQDLSDQWKMIMYICYQAIDELQVSSHRPRQTDHQMEFKIYQHAWQTVVDMGNPKNAWMDPLVMSYQGHLWRWGQCLVVGWRGRLLGWGGRTRSGRWRAWRPWFWGAWYWPHWHSSPLPSLSPKAESDDIWWSASSHQASFPSPYHHNHCPNILSLRC